MPRAGVVAAMVVGLFACGDEQSGDGAADQTTVITVGGAVGLAQATADAVWVVTDDGVARIDPRTNTLLKMVEMDRPEYIVSDGSAVGVTLFDANHLVRIDTATNTIAETLVVPGNPSGAIVVGNAIWVTSHAAISGVVVAFDSVWVSDEPNGTVTRFPLSLLG